MFRPSLTSTVWVSLRLFASQNPDPERIEMRVDAVSDEFVENRIGSQRAVLADFLGQFAGLIGQGFDALGQFGFFRALGLDLILHAGDLFGGGAFFGLGDLELGCQ